MKRLLCWICLIGICLIGQIQAQSYYVILALDWGSAYEDQAIPDEWIIEDFALMDKDVQDYVTDCDSDYAFDVNEIQDLVAQLDAAWVNQDDINSNQDIWDDEWTTFGTCFYTEGFADDELDYFQKGLDQYNSYSVGDALSNAGYDPTIDTNHTYQEYEDVIKNTFDTPLLLCRYDGTNYILSTVVLCFDTSLQLTGCNSGDLPTDITDITCPTDENILYPSSDYYSQDNQQGDISANEELRAVSVDTGIDPVLVALIAVVPAAAGLVLLAVGVYAIYKNRDKIQKFELKESVTAFFTSCLVGDPSEVEYPGLSAELAVKSYPLDKSEISQIPVLGEILTELPVGLGIKGDICRKIFKIVMCQKTTDLASEFQFGDYDLELLAIVDKATPEVSLHVRKTLTGFRLKNLAVEQAKNVEIFTNFADYFRSRDVTQNEILIFRHSKEKLVLYYSEQALHDAAANVVAPSVHAFSTEFSNVWHVSSIGEPILGKKIFCRCIVHLLKGHGGSYNIPQSTWSFYKEKKLDPLSIFRVLRHFERNPGFQRAFTHLQVLGVVPNGVTAAEAWGEALWSLNDILARFTTKFSMNFPLNAETIEKWNEIKRQLMSDWLIKRRDFCIRHGFIESENKSSIVLPEELKSFNNFLFNTSNLEEVPTALKQTNPGNPDEDEITTEKQLKDLYARSISKKQQIQFKQSLSSHLNLKTPQTEEEEEDNTNNQEKDLISNSQGITASRLKKTNHAISQFDIITPDKLYADRGQQWYDDQVFNRGSKYTTEYAYSNKISAQGQKEMESMDDGTIKDKENPHKKNAFDLLARVWVIAKLQKGLIFLIGLFIVIQLAFRVYAAYTTGLVSTAFTNYTSLSKIRKLLVELIILVAGEVVFQVVAASVITVFATKVLKAFGVHLYKTILYQDVEFHERVQTGEKIMKLSSDSHAILNLIGSILPNMFSSTMLLIGSIIACFIANWILGFIVAGYGGVLMITGVIYGYYGREKSREFRGAVGNVFRVSYDIMTNINIIRRFGTEESEIEEFNKLIDKAADISSQLALGTTAFSAFGVGIGIFIRVLLLWVGGALIVGTSITTGTVLTVLFLAGIARQAIVTCYQTYGHLMQQVGSLERLFYLFEHQGRIHKPGVGRVLASVSGKLEFYQVSFCYPSRKDNAILKTINFSVQKGDVLGIYGASGSGKSTIGYLADVLYRPTYGYIYMDGAKVKELDVFWLRNHIGVLNNDAAKILTASISDNITWGLGRVENSRVSQICEKIGLDKWINSLPDNYDTIIGESGIQLSDIHKRMIAIARLMLRDPTVLIVDDPTQGLGPEVEGSILGLLREFFQGKSVVVLSADKKVLRELKCNKFMKLQEGSFLPIDEIESSS